MEVWAAPAKVTQVGPARIFTISKDVWNRNLTIGQGETRKSGDRLQIRLTQTRGNGDGQPYLHTSIGSIRAGVLHHIVVTSRKFDRTVCYIDGKPSGAPVTGIGDFSNWVASYRIAMGNELGADRKWLGQLRGVAMYPRALTADQVRRLHEEGRRRVRAGKAPVSIDSLKAAIATDG